MSGRAGSWPWPCDNYEAPLTCWTTPRPKTVICEGCRSAFPRGPEVQRILAARGESLAGKVRALADELLAFDCVEHAALVPSHVDVPDDYEAGLYDAARRLRALLDVAETTGEDS